MLYWHPNINQHILAAEDNFNKTLEINYTRLISLTSARAHGTVIRFECENRFEYLERRENR